MNRTIYIADDDQEIRMLIQAFLERENYQVEIFEDGEVLLNRFNKIPADLLILDISMPVLDGLSLCNKIRQESNVPIIFVSARGTEFDRVIGINMGADDYMVKPFSPMELVARVNSVFRRMNMTSTQSPTQNTLSFGNVTLNLSTHYCTVDEKPLKLTPTEFNFLSYLFKNSKIATPKEDLLKKVWHIEDSKDFKIIDDTLKRLRKKLKETNVSIVSIWGYGFRLELSDETQKEDI